jgi:biotin carboxyl carrier protein
MTRLRVVPIDATGLPDARAAVEIDPDDRSGPAGSVVDLGRGRFRVADETDPDREPRGDPATGFLRALPVPPGAARRYEVVVDGWRFELEVEEAARAALRRRATRTVDADATSGPLDIRAIIPGRVAAVRVTPGDAVEAGDTLLVVEAMKMQNELRAPRAGTVERMAVGEGQTIERGDLLVVLR